MIELPQRDCLVLHQDEHDRKQKREPYWLHVRFESADGEGPMWDGEDVVTYGHDDRHMIIYSDEELDLANVTDWREMSVLEVKS